MQGSVKGKPQQATSPNKPASGKKKKPRQRKPKTARPPTATDQPSPGEISTPNQLAGSTLAGAASAALAKKTPSSAQPSGTPAAEVGTSKSTHTVIPQSGLDIVVGTLPENGGYAVSAQTETFQSFLEKGMSVRTSTGRIPVHLALHYKRWKVWRKGLAQFCPHLPPAVRLRLWERLALMVRSRTELDHPYYQGYKNRNRSSRVPGLLTRSLTEQLKILCYMEPSGLVSGGSTTDSYWQGTGNKSGDGISASGGLGTAHQLDVRKYTGHSENGDPWPLTPFGSLLNSSGITLTDVPFFRTVPGTQVDINAQGGPNSGLEAKLFMLEPDDPAWGLAAGGAFTATVPFSGTGLAKITFPVSYVNGAGATVKTTEATRIVVVLRNSMNVSVAVTGMQWLFVQPESIAPDYDVVMANSADVIDGMAVGTVQLANDIIVKPTGPLITREGAWVSSNLMTFEQAVESVETDTGTLGIPAYNETTITELPKYSAGLVSDGVCFANRVSEVNQQFVDPENVWEKAINEGMTQAVTVIKGAAPTCPLQIVNTVARAITQVGQLLAQKPCVVDPTDMARAEAVQAGLPCAHAYGEGGETHNAYIDALTLAYDAACIAFPRIEQIGNVAKWVWDAVSGFF